MPIFYQKIYPLEFQQFFACVILLVFGGHLNVESHFLWGERISKKIVDKKNFLLFVNYRSHIKRKNYFQLLSLSDSLKPTLILT